MARVGKIFCIILFLTFLSCEKEIDFKGKLSAPKIVLNSLISSDSIITTQLFESRFFLEQENDYFYEIKEAEVDLYVNNTFIESMRYIPEYYFAGYYKSFYRPKNGDKIKITASAFGFENVFCETEIKPQIEVGSLDVEKVIYNSESIDAEDKYIEYKFKLKIRDIPGETNYYRLVNTIVYYHKDGRYTTKDYTFDFTDLVSEEEKDNTGGYLEDYLNKNVYNIFSDRLFQGKEYTLNFSIWKTYDQYNSSLWNESQEVYIDLQHISKEYYLYLQSRAASETEPLIPIPGFSEPVQIFSNVENGIGILGSYTSNIVTIKMPVLHGRN